MKSTIFFLLLSSFAVAQVQLDGNWWKSATSESKGGAVDGLVACLQDDQGHKLPALTTPMFVEKVDTYYQHNPARDGVAKVILGLPYTPPKRREGGEHYAEKYGYFDELYWKPSSDQQQKGFVIGYISCRTGNIPGNIQVQSLVKRISDWYAASQPSQDAKVPELLQRFMRRKSGEK